MSFFEIGIYAPIHSENIGTLWRSAYQLGAAGIFIIGKSRRSQVSDTAKTVQQIPLRTFDTWEDFLVHRPIGTRIVGIEIGGSPLAQFSHPSEAIYVLGSEANGLPEHVQKGCDFIVSIESLRYASYNVAVTGSLVMYHRQIICMHDGKIQ
ncbi:MAG: TrmH family RNA methyltransferase [Anaerolineaceae bacterium]|jgi:tRNA G18 (ribose-2'-O)-methylase SpoU|nr:MAG: rRNA methyltransferase [Chloroflexi bacterium HGW-Chloroflexi-8]